MGNIPTIGSPLSYINTKNIQQSGLGANCTGYQYVKMLNNSCVCATGYTGSVVATRNSSGIYNPAGCSLISGNTNFIIPTLTIPT